MFGTSGLMNKLNKFKSIKYRHAYLKEHIRIGIATQIRILRKNADLSQSQLAELIGTKQGVISRLEDPDSGAVNLNTLLKIAEAFDVGLLVKFSSFGKFINESQDISPKALAVSNYTEEIENIKINDVIYFSEITNNDTVSKPSDFVRINIFPEVKISYAENKNEYSSISIKKITSPCMDGFKFGTRDNYILNSVL